MKDEELPPLSPEASALLDAERSRPGPPAAIRARLLDRLALTLAPAGGAPPAPPTVGSPPSSRDPSTTPPAPVPGAAGAAALGAAAGTAGATLILKPGLIVAFVLGAALGAAGTALLQRAPASAPPLGATPPASPSRPAPARRTPLPALQPAGQPAPTIVVRAAADEESATPARPAPSSAPARRAPRAPKREEAADALAAERALVEMARAALARSRPGDALLALARHAERFPRGGLAEERDGLRVLALASSGDLEGARVQADRFRQRYPKSLLLPAIDAAFAGSGARE